MQLSNQYRKTHTCEIWLVKITKPILSILNTLTVLEEITKILLMIAITNSSCPMCIERCLFDEIGFFAKKAILSLIEAPLTTGMGRAGRATATGGIVGYRNNFRNLRTQAEFTQLSWSLSRVLPTAFNCSILIMRCDFFRRNRRRLLSTERTEGTGGVYGSRRGKEREMRDEKIGGAGRWRGLNGRLM